MMRTKASAALCALTLLVAACTTDRAPVAPETVEPAPLAPVAAAPVATVSLDAPAWSQAAAIGDPSLITSISRSTPLPADITVSQRIGPSGGKLEIPAAGLSVIVPAGALRTTTVLTATALKGDMVAYEFGPHGTRFAVPLLVSQRVAGTNAGSLPFGAVVKVGYFTGREQIDPIARKVNLAEVIPTLGIALGQDVKFLVWHFSGYIIAWDRRGGGENGERGGQGGDQDP